MGRAVSARRERPIPARSGWRASLRSPRTPPRQARARAAPFEKFVCESKSMTLDRYNIPGSDSRLGVVWPAAGGTDRALANDSRAAAMRRGGPSDPWRIAGKQVAREELNWETYESRSQVHINRVFARRHRKAVDGSVLGSARRRGGGQRAAADPSFYAVRHHRLHPGGHARLGLQRRP